MMRLLEHESVAGGVLVEATLDARAGQRTTLYLVGKDGGVKVREQQGWSLKALFGTIDRMPMRQ